MTSLTHLHPRASACSQAAVRRRTALDDLSDAAQSFIATLRVWRRRMRERDQLARLDDRMLSDIGLTRVDADYLANKPFWRE
jgi:uncharacterized protein YjiS (DUF1127 family)